MSAWVKCSDEMPPLFTPVLVVMTPWNNNGYRPMTVAERGPDSWHQFYGNRSLHRREITHWRFLPEAP